MGLKAVWFLLTKKFNDDLEMNHLLVSRSYYENWIAKKKKLGETLRSVWFLDITDVDVT